MEYQVIPQPDEISKTEKQDAGGAYLMMFAAAALGLPFPIINMLAAIIYYYINKDKGRFVKFNTLQSLYSQLFVTLMNSFIVILTIWNFVYRNPFDTYYWWSLGIIGGLNLLYVIFSIVAAVKAFKGKFFYFFIIGPLAYKQAYIIRPEEDKTQPVNHPPV